MTTKATTTFSIVPKFQEANETIVFSVFWNLRKQNNKKYNLKGLPKFSKISVSFDL